MTMTNHAREDRADRLTYIALTIGFGNIVFERKSGEFRECITDTGVLMIKNLTKEVLVTAYIIGIDKAVLLYKKEFGNDAMLPRSLYRTIINNRKHLKAQNLARY